MSIMSFSGATAGQVQSAYTLIAAFTAPSIGKRKSHHMTAGKRRLALGLGANRDIPANGRGIVMRIKSRLCPRSTGPDRT